MITKREMRRVAKPVVLIAEELSPATLEALGPDFEVRNCNGADRSELLSALSKGVDAVLVRSATKMDAEAISAAKGLKVIARAGVGLDNVDIPAATAAGVMVVNAPTSNIVSAAELAIGLLLASARSISPAHAALRNGKWARSKYTGAELFEKTLGIVGFGRIGQLVAARMQAFGMNVVAYDPYLQPARAAQLNVRLVDLDELLKVSDFITIHYEAALYEAIKAGKVAGAGIDVFATEPCTDSPLFTLDNVVATPHLGASTDEAQERAGIAVAISVRKALSGELVPDAVNVKGGVIEEAVRPALPLVEKLAQVAIALATDVVSSVDVEVRGEISAMDVSVLATSALKGALIGQKIVAIDELDLDLKPTSNLLFLRYTDQPGVVGVVGNSLGKLKINIADMQVGRTQVGGKALMALTVDSVIPNDLIQVITKETGATLVRFVNLVSE